MSTESDTTLMTNSVDLPNSLVTENEKLKKSLQEMVLFVKQQKGEIQLLREENKDMENIRNEYQVLRTKLKKVAENDNIDSLYNLRKEHDSVVAENLNLQETLVGQEDEISNLTKEKDSLIATLKLLQDELLMSESRHHHPHHHS